MNDSLIKYYPPLVSGLEFDSIVEAKHCIQKNILESLYPSVSIIKSDKRRYHVKCVCDGCKFEITCYLMSTGSARIKKCSISHSCDGLLSSNRARVSSMYVSGEIRGLLFDNQKVRPNNIIKNVRRTHSIIVPYQTAWRSKALALKDLSLHTKESFCMIRPFLEQIKLLMPQSVTDIVVDPDGKFERNFICFTWS